MAGCQTSGRDIFRAGGVFREGIKNSLIAGNRYISSICLNRITIAIYMEMASRIIHEDGATPDRVQNWLILPWHLPPATWQIIPPGINFGKTFASPKPPARAGLLGMPQVFPKLGAGTEGCEGLGEDAIKISRAQLDILSLYQTSFGMGAIYREQWWKCKS